MPQIDFITQVHTATKRNYLERVVDCDKAACAEVAMKFGQEYWDGDRKYGYGGFRYDGRWKPVVERMIKHYQLKSDARILDVGCGKGFMLYDFMQALPNAQVTGIDVSCYGIEQSKPEVRPFLKYGLAQELPFEDNSFDLVISLNTLHNLYLPSLWTAIKEIERVGRQNKYIVVESYRNEQEKVNLMYWQLTCRAFHTPAEWEWLYREAGYRGDYSFIYFE